MKQRVTILTNDAKLVASGTLWMLFEDEFFEYTVTLCEDGSPKKIEREPRRTA